MPRSQRFRQSIPSRNVRTLLLLLALMPAWDKGWDHRASSPYVTDPANTTYWLGEAYPTTRNGVTAGFTTDLSANARDRDSAVDPREAGMIFQNNTTGVQNVFRVDVPAPGDYSIRLALGDAGAAGLCAPYIQIRDGSTPLATIDHSSSVTSGTDMIDATGTTYSISAWPGSNTPITVTLTGTVLNFALGTPAVGTNLSMLAHNFVSQLNPFVPPRLARTMAPQQRMAA
jgi:hypothetical protein